LCSSCNGAPDRVYKQVFAGMVNGEQTETDSFRGQRRRG
jgi:hypothetical protein